MTQPQNPQPNDSDEVRARISVEAPGFKFGIDESDSWILVAKVIVLVLAVYGGIKLINHFL